MKKFFTLTFIMLLAISMSAQRITSVWSGEFTFNAEGSSSFSDLAASNFASLQLGDYIMVTVSEITNPDGWAQINMAGKNPWTTVPSTNWGAVQVGINRYQINDATVLASIKAGGLGVQGKYFTLTDISINVSNVVSLWSGEFTFNAEGSSSFSDLAASNFASLQLGDYIMVTVSEITNPDGWAQINMAGKNPWTTVPGTNWGAVQVGINRYQINDATVLASIKAGGLGVQGKYFTLTDISISNPYTRSVTSSNFGTICLPYASSSITGATIYSIAGRTEGGIVLEEESSMEAGVPYIFQANASTLEVICEGARADVQTATGLVGNLSASPLAVPQGSYIIKSDNMLHQVPAETNVTVGQNRAYIDLSGLEEITSVHGRTVMAVENTTTGLESISGEIRCHKVVKNGQILILKEEGVYDMLGQKIQ